MMHGSLAWTLGAFIIALGILIIVHELGHYLVARLVGVKVLRFSVGFGKPLVSRRFGSDGTEWALAAFPLGGYVKMLDETEGPVPPEEMHRAFNRQSVGRRSLVVLAGPSANLLLAVLLYVMLFMTGVDELRPILGAPPIGTAAARAGIENGELVRSVSGKPVATLTDLRWELMRSVLDRQAVELELENQRGEIAFRKLDTSEIDVDQLDSDFARKLGFAPFTPPIRPVIGQIKPGSVADAAGIRVDDEVIAVDGRAIHSWGEFVEAVSGAPGKLVVLTIRRAEQTVAVDVVPRSVEESGKTIGRIGVGARDDPNIRKQLVIHLRLGPIDAFARAFRQTWDTSILSVRMIGRMLTGQLSWKNISGPVTIADYAGQSAQLGLSHYLKFLALISISLGVLNLLPIPVLDGGHLLYYFAEFIKGGPLSERVMEIGQQIGLGLLILLMVFAFYNDINRLVSG
jgi:regulator of sigma E protease